MNKILRFASLCTFALISTMTFAQTTITFDASEVKGANTESGKADEITKDGVTINCTNAAFAAVNFSSKIAEYRFYAKATATISSTVGNITKVVFTCTESGTKKNGPGCFKDPTPGSYTYEGTTGTWTGDAASFTLATSAQVRATKIEVTVSGSGTGETVAAPTISGETPFKESTMVTITGPENSLIYYTTDGQDPDDRATQYTAPFTLDATTTVKAIAYVGDTQSSVATKEFVKAVPAKTYTVAEALQLVNGGNIPKDTVEVKGIVSTYKSSQNTNLSKYGNLSFYISDDGQAASELEAYACFDLNKARFTSLDQLALGDTVIVRGILKSFNGKPELDKGCYLTYHGKVAVVKEYTDATVAEANAFTAEKNYVNLKFTNATVAYVDGDYAYVRESGKAIILQGLGIAMKQGQTLNGSVKGNFTLRGGLIPYFLKNDDTNADNLAVTGDSTGVDPVKCTVAEIVNHKADYIVAEGTITSEVSDTYTNYYINDAEGNKVQIYGNIDVVKDAQADTKYSLEAVVNGAFKKAVEIRPIKLTVVTGINDIKVNAAKADNVLYNLAGQRVSAAYKGVVISNGKKFYNK